MGTNFIRGAELTPYILQVLICEDTFPTVLRRSEVVEIRIIDISPGTPSGSTSYPLHKLTLSSQSKTR